MSRKKLILENYMPSTLENPRYGHSIIRPPCYYGHIFLSCEIPMCICLIVFELDQSNRKLSQVLSHGSQTLLQVPTRFNDLGLHLAKTDISTNKNAVGKAHLNTLSCLLTVKSVNLILACIGPGSKRLFWLV